MQHDEVIWQVIRHNHCSFMAKITAGIFCRNPYNLTGICNRSSCPLANSRYATIRDHDGVFYLYMKTIERAHMPNKLWERVKLPRNYMQALGIISKYVEHWPKFLQHKIKQRLTKMTQMRIRMKKIELKTRETIVLLPRKEKKREARREEKAEKAANLGKIIEDEVLHRLKEGVYPSDIINYPSKPFVTILEKEIEDELAKEYVELEDEEEQDMEDAFTGFNVNTADADVGLDEGEEGDDDHDTEVVVHRKRGRKQSSFALKKAEQRGDKAKKKAKVVVEVERDDADERQVAAH